MNMVASNTTIRKLEPGSTGWTCRDLDEPRIAQQWHAGNYEMINGVIAIRAADGLPRVLTPGSTGWSNEELDQPEHRQEWQHQRYELIRGVIADMPPPALNHSHPVSELLYRIQDHHRKRRIRISSGCEVELYIDEFTRFRVDGIVMLPDDLKREQDYLRHADQDPQWIGKVHVPPTLVIESVSLGREVHDYDVKRKRFEEFALPNYWIVNAIDRDLLLLTLDGGRFVEECHARGDDVVKPSAFPGLEFPVSDLFLHA